MQFYGMARVNSYRPKNSFMFCRAVGSAEHHFEDLLARTFRLGADWQENPAKPQSAAVPRMPLGEMAFVRFRKAPRVCNRNYAKPNQV